MKKIGLLISTLNSGGAERTVSRLSKILSKEYEIYIILYEDTYIEYDYDGKLINLNIKASNSLIKQCILPFLRKRKLKKIKNNLRLDAVISFLDSPNIVNVLSKTKKCKTIVSVRNYTLKEEKQNIKSKILSYIMGKLYKKADAIVPVSNVIKESLKNKYKIDDKNFKVIYNPYDYDEINNLCKEEIEEQYKEIFSKKTFISVGRLSYQKGFWHLIKAFSIVKKKYEDVNLVIIGKDFQGEKVQKLINELNLQDSVFLLGHQKNPFKYISRSYAYIMTSLFEGFPNALVEAMNCGIPVVSTDCLSGPREILDGEQDIRKKTEKIEYATYGIMIKPFKEKELWDKDIMEDEDINLAEAMYTILNTNEMQEHYSKQSRLRAKAFSYEICKTKYEEII